MSLRGRQVLALACGLLAVSSMWFYVNGIVIAHQERQAADLQLPRGNLSDLYPRWLGARELLLRGRDPYSREVTLEIQRGYWGRELDASRPNDPKDQQGFAYPVYVAFLLAPTVRLDFAIVRVLFLWWSAGFTVISVLFWKRIMCNDLSRWETLIALLLVFGSYPFAEAFHLQQPLLLEAFLLAASFLARRYGWLALSGMLMALATIKPQVALLPVLLLLFWVSAEWRQRQRWLWGFASMMVLLFGASEYVLHGWIFRFYAGVRAYRDYTSGGAFLDWLVGTRWSGLCRVILLLPVLLVAWKSRRADLASVASRGALSLVLVAAVCTAPILGTYNQLLLIPALFLVWDQRMALQCGGMISRTLTKIIAALVVWPWVACGLLVVAKVVFHADQFVRWAWQLPLYTTLSLPIALLTLLIRWPLSSGPVKQAFPATEILS